jgi:hypothetical protein
MASLLETVLRAATFASSPYSLPARISRRTFAAFAGLAAAGKPLPDGAYFTGGCSGIDCHSWGFECGWYGSGQSCSSNQCVQNFNNCWTPTNCWCVQLDQSTFAACCDCDCTYNNETIFECVCEYIGISWDECQTIGQ